MSSPDPPESDSTRSLPAAADAAPTLTHVSPAPGDPTEPGPADAGRYRRLRPHKEGGMGRVSVALDTELNREVAFKEIRPHLADNPAALRHFLFEAEVTGALEHPGVVPVYGLGRAADGRPFYAMRFVQGRSLAEAIRALHTRTYEPHEAPGRAAEFRRLLTRFVSVCQTIDYAHSRGVIHRDLKPANVMLGPFGETLVVDWGLAKRMRDAESDSGRAGGVAAVRVDEAAPGADDPHPAAGAADPPSHGPTRTRPGDRIGTPPYWAPEQAAGRPDLHDERTDVYGLGAILFEIVTGRPPHPDGAHAAEAPSPVGHGVGVDEELDEIVRSALAIDRADRQQSVAELAQQMEGWLGEQPVAGQRAVVRALEQELAREPGRHDLADHLARQQANLGLMYRALDKPMRAAVAFSYAVRWYEGLEVDGRAGPRDRAELANHRLLLAECFDDLGLADRAAEERAAAKAIYDGLIAAHPGEFRANIASIIATHAGEPEPARPAPVAPAPTEPPRPDQTVESMLLGTPGEPPPAAAVPPPEAAPAAGSVPVAPAARHPGAEPELVQGYTAVRVLGEGALGRVLLARDNVLNRLVAIKDFRADLSDTARVRVTREMQVTARLVHPHVIRVYTYGLHAGTNRPFMVMEYIPGKTLREELRAFHDTRPRQHRFARADAQFARLISALADACDGVHFAHTQGVLHRDPKPANVVIREDGSAVVIDWGLAKVVGSAADPAADPAALPADADPHLTVEGAVVGTPAYMPPEHARGTAHGDADHRGDVYSLGAGLFEVLTGALPYDGVTANEIVRQLLFGKPRRPTELNPEVPFELEAVCAAAMAYYPDDRYPTAAELAADLRAWLAGKSVSVRARGRLRRLWDQLTGRG